jgi:hypothetical protein
LNEKAAGVAEEIAEPEFGSIVVGSDSQNGCTVASFPAAQVGFDGGHPPSGVAHRHYKLPGASRATVEIFSQLSAIFSNPAAIRRLSRKEKTMIAQRLRRLFSLAEECSPAKQGK